MASSVWAGVISCKVDLYTSNARINRRIGTDELQAPVLLLARRESGRHSLPRRASNLELTDAGRLEFGYAQDILALGSKQEESLRNFPAGGRLLDFRVGVADAVPKTIAYRLIERGHPLAKACADQHPWGLSAANRRSFDPDRLVHASRRTARSWRRAC